METSQAQLQFLNQPGPHRSSHSKVSTRSAPARLPPPRTLSPLQRGRSPGPRTPVLQPPVGRDLSISPLSLTLTPGPRRNLSVSPLSTAPPPEPRQSRCLLSQDLPQHQPQHLPQLLPRLPVPHQHYLPKKPPSPGLPPAPTYKTEPGTPARAYMSGIDPSGVPQSAHRPGASKNLVDFGVSTGIFRNVMRLLPSSSQANIFPFSSSRSSHSPVPAYLRWLTKLLIINVIGISLQTCKLIVRNVDTPPAAFAVRTFGVGHLRWRNLHIVASTRARGPNHRHALVGRRHDD